MQETHSGGCACGAVRYRVHGRPAFGVVCHCNFCQRRLASAFSVIATFDEKYVEITQGELAECEHRSDESGRWLKMNFCQKCGTTVCHTVEFRPGMKTIAAGTFDDPNWFTIDRHIWVRSKLPWVTIPDGVSAYPKAFSQNAVHNYDITLPFFAYGIFRPGQIGFFQLKEFLSEAPTPCEIKGSLLLRDGLPIIDKTGKGKVKGALLRFQTSNTAEAYRRVAAMEPDKHYVWGASEAEGKSANVLFGRTPGKGSTPCEDELWDGWKDPLFTSALDVIDETLKESSDFEWDLKPLFRLQMAYLLLWSAIERYVSLRYHLGDKVTKKIYQLANETSFCEGVKQHVTEARDVYRADRPDQKIKLDPQKPNCAHEYYYQIRSNITHRGKGAVGDHGRVRKSLSELILIFRDVLKQARIDAQEVI